MRRSILALDSQIRASFGEYELAGFVDVHFRTGRNFWARWWTKTNANRLQLVIPDLLMTSHAKAAGKT